MKDKSPAISVAVESLGCKLNQAEVASWVRQLEGAGYRVVDSRERAQVYVLNTCTLTCTADRKSRHLLRMARRRNPGALVVATGCYAERAAQEIAGAGAADLVLGNGDKDRLVEAIEASRFSCRCSESTLAAECHASHCHPERERRTLRSSTTDERSFAEPPLPLPKTSPFRMTIRDAREKSGGGPRRVARESRTRALVRIQDGCDEFCTYCIVPSVRGRQRSRPAAEVLNEVKERVGEGCKEVVLTGTQVGAYGRGAGDSESLFRLVKRLLAETAVARLRITSIHPHDLTDELLGLWEDQRLCRHIHLSLQSGSDPVLKRMGRPYTTAAFARAVEEARRRIADVAITTDVIVGFPGESDAEFEESRLFCQSMGFARVHVFPYSARPGTPAAAIGHQAPDAVKRLRSRAMLKAAEEGARRFREGFLGRRLPVLWEAPESGEGPERLWGGLTGNYIKVYARAQEDLANRLLEVRLARAYRDGLWGERLGRTETMEKETT